MITKMRIRDARTRLLLGVLFLAGLLLAGRTALALHDYQHDLAKPNTECKVCALGHVFKSELVEQCATHTTPAFEVLCEFAGCITLVVYPRASYLSRAPPSIII